MKLTLRIGAAIGIAALGACAQSTPDNTANLDSNAAAASEETVLPPDEGDGTTDTLQNQLDQLNESEASNSDVTSNESNTN